MNLLMLLLPKKNVDYLYDNFTIRQAMEKMKRHNYSNVPIIERKTGKYVASIADGDILRYLVENRLDFDELSKLPLSDVPIQREIEAVPWFCDDKELFRLMMNQNYVPVVDDHGSFIGIVTRQKFMREFMKEFPKDKEEKKR